MRILLIEDDADQLEPIQTALSEAGHIVDGVEDGAIAQWILSKREYDSMTRDLCLFVLGMNTAFRANELLSLKVGQVRSLLPGDVLSVKQSKTGKFRQVTVNNTVVEAIALHLAANRLMDDEPLFMGKRVCLTVPTVSTMVKTWCENAGLKGSYGSHTLRKTWGYWQRMERGTAVPLLMEAFGHATQQQTLAYLGIQAAEIAQIYEMEL
ncbi:MAG: tyrosine-type recombinase/integrase [Cyanobacteria bacterium CAN_BIN43]|nr:tyrosine-type recombinase/integrase [Cyanobacteria bacterium CAN_BIN43]